MTTAESVAQIALALPPRPRDADLLLALVAAEQAGYERGVRLATETAVASRTESCLVIRTAESTCCDVYRRTTIGGIIAEEYLDSFEREPSMTEPQLASAMRRALLIFGDEPVEIQR